MSKSEQEDSKLKYRAALDKKAKIPKKQVSENETELKRRIIESSGKTPKVFRRKSG